MKTSEQSVREIVTLTFHNSRLMSPSVRKKIYFWLIEQALDFYCIGAATYGKKMTARYILKK